MIKLICNYLRTANKLLMAVCFALSSLSVVLLAGISMSGYATSRQILTQIAASLIGILAAVIISLIDYRGLASLWKLYVPVSLFLVALTYFIGIKRVEYVDDRAWLKVPFLSLTFQPSEILKIAFILFFALHLEKVAENINNPSTLLSLCAHGALPTLMVVAQGDDGTALVFVVVFCAMMFAAGLSWKYISVAAGAVAAISPVIWFMVFTDDKRMRVLTVLNPELDPMGKGWQQSLGKLSIGSGQVWGKGIFSDSHHYVPEMHNDFIFAFAGEAMGFMGSCLILALLGLLMLLILDSARTARDPLGKYICIGVFGIIAFQTVVNLGMCLAVLPVIGVTLPLLSAGGTSVCMTYIGIGLVLSVYRHSNRNLFISSR